MSLLKCETKLLNPSLNDNSLAENGPDALFVSAFFSRISLKSPLTKDPYWRSMVLMRGNVASMLILEGSPAYTPIDIGPISLFNISRPNLLITKCSSVSSNFSIGTNASLIKPNFPFNVKKLLNRSFTGFSGNSNSLPFEKIKRLRDSFLLCIMFFSNSDS